MKENQSENPSEPQDTNIIIYPNEDNKEYHHNIKESSLPFGQEEKLEIETGTTTSTLGFLNDEKEKNNPLSNLSKSLEKTEGSSNNSLNEQNKKVINDKTEKAETESFYQKTKRWAGTAWSYINIKNYFPKTEYIEYRNSNGDMVKIPKKKIPLKKKPNEPTNEQHIVNKTVDRDNPKYQMYAADNVPFASHFI